MQQTNQTVSDKIRQSHTDWSTGFYNRFKKITFFGKNETFMDGSRSTNVL
jgi:hypothetical protein